MEVENGVLSVQVNEKYVDEILVETSVDTLERGGATKVVSLEAEVKGAQVELLAGEAEVSGKANYRLLYLDRQNRLCGLDYFKDFKCRVKGEGFAPTGRGSVSFRIPDAEARIAGDEISLSAVVDVLVTYSGEVEKPAVTAITGAETLAAEVVSERVERRERVIELDKVADVGLGIKKIVLFRADAMPISVTGEGTGVTLNGEVRGSVLYLNEADEVVEMTVSIPFSEGSDGEAKDYEAAVKSARVILTDDDDGNSVEVEASILLTEIVYREEAQSAIAAAASDKTFIEEKREKVCEERFVGRALYEESLGGTVVATDEGGSVAFVRAGCYAIAGVTVGDGEVKVEGVAAFRAALATEEGYTSLPAELPFVYVLPFAEAKEGMSAEVKFVITDAMGSLRGKDVTINAKAHVEIRLYERRCYAYLSEVKEGAPIPESEAGISVYFAEKGEDLWSIAKSVGVLPSALVKANPFLNEPLLENKKVLIFRQK